jgi:hypothetical protein
VGEIESEIAGRSHFQADVQLGEHINLERELENQRDKNAIRVDNSRFQPVGYVPRPTVAWLAPLLDSGKIRIEGYVPTHPHSIRTTDPERLPLAIMIHLTKAGLSILETTGSQDKPRALHELALHAYRPITMPGITNTRPQPTSR